MEDSIFLDAYQSTIKKIERNAEKIGAAFPQVANGPGGKYNSEPASYWTGGFWGGLLWLAYRETGQQNLMELACRIEEMQDAPLNEFMELHHDVGFMWLPTAVWNYRTTGCQESKVRGIKAASLLAGRYNPKGQFLRSWNDSVRENSQGLVIIDCMMNLPLLYWAGKELDDPRFKHIAVAHADTVCRHFIREEGTVPHIMSFNADTGECLGAVHGQGKSADSVWSRGQAWALYGMTISYRETKIERYLETAKKVARKFLELLGEDSVPCWDFCSDPEDIFARDSSAACIAASGLLELAGQVSTKEEKEEFETAAKRILRAVIEEAACFDDSTEGIIRMGTVNYFRKRYINVPIIYGDFYFAEALGKLRGLPGMF